MKSGSDPVVTRAHRLALVFAALVLLPAAAPPDEEVAAKADESMRARVRQFNFSGTVLIAREGKVLFRQGYGMANLEHDVPNTPETKFRLGSITKQFTAMCVLVLQERGKLDVRDKVKKHLPDAPKAWDEITIHHLLTHTSGIPNYTGFPDYSATQSLRTTLDQLVARFRDKPLKFQPGEKHEYSNSGYVLLGQIIEKVSVQSYATFLKENVLTPLGMKDTGFDAAAPVLKHRAQGYSKLMGVITSNSTYIDMSVSHAAGALYSTVDDLQLWDRALDSETLVKKKTLEAMFTPFKDGYAYGWVVGKAFGRRTVSHGGAINGFSTDIQRFPAEKLLVVVLRNVEGPPVGAVGHDLAAIALGEKYRPPGERQAVKIDPKCYDAYIGRYECVDPKIIFTVTRDGDRLRVQITGQPKHEVFPESETSFFYKVVDAQIDFVKDEAGKVARLVIHQNGIDREAEKQPGPEKKP